MITTRIPRTRWHYLAYGGIAAGLAIACPVISHNAGELG
jgi:hypothetical protein